MDDEEKGEGATLGRRVRNRTPKPPNPTWADAAKKVVIGRPIWPLGS